MVLQFGTDVALEFVNSTFRKGGAKKILQKKKRKIKHIVLLHLFTFQKVEQIYLFKKGKTKNYDIWLHLFKGGKKVKPKTLRLHLSTFQKVKKN